MVRVMSHFLRDMPDSPPPPRTRRSADLWAAAKSDYLAGGSAAEVCERHGLSVSTFRWRARNEGWRRADHPETAEDSPYVYDSLDQRHWIALEAEERAAELDRPPPTEGQAAGDSADAIEVYDEQAAYAAAASSPKALAAIAWANAERAIRRGHMIEARGWTRLHRDLQNTFLTVDPAAKALADAKLAAAMADLDRAMSGLKRDTAIRRAASE